MAIAANKTHQTEDGKNGHQPTKIVPDTMPIIHDCIERPSENKALPPCRWILNVNDDDT
jgi:hypothetical protein